MTILIVIGTILLVLDCLLLSLLILVQLPKKEAGIGMAFGGGAADALFGAGSGTALTQLTKYTSVAFFVLVFALSVMNNHNQGNTGSALGNAMGKTPLKAPPATTAPAPANNSSKTSPGLPLTISTNNITAPVAPAPAPANSNAQPKK